MASNKSCLAVSQRNERQSEQIGPENEYAEERNADSSSLRGHLFQELLCEKLPPVVQLETGR